MNHKINITTLAFCLGGLFSHTVSAGASCQAVRVTTTPLPQAQLVMSECGCESGSYNGVNQVAILSTVQGSYLIGGEALAALPNATPSTSFTKAVYCQTSTSTTCSGTLPDVYKRTSGVYSFAYTGDVGNLKARYNCRWDQPSHSWKSVCLGSSCVPK